MANKQEKVITLEVGDDGVYSAKPARRQRQQITRVPYHKAQEVEIARFIVKNGENFNEFLRTVTSTVALVSKLMNKIEKI